MENPIIKVIGCDPGSEGAIAMFSLDGTRLETWRFTQYSHRQMLAIAQEISICYRGLTAVALEDVHSMSRDFKPQLFKFGHNTGFATALLLLASSQEIVKVDPKAWQYEFRLGALDDSERKRVGTARTKALFDHVSAKRITQDLFAAILIAEYHRRSLTGELTHGRKEGSRRKGEGIRWAKE